MTKIRGIWVFCPFQNEGDKRIRLSGPIKGNTFVDILDNMS